ncbi:MAG: DUF4382 domain-containing protein [Candidatus Nanohaloarchaea archaeon]
MKAKHSLALVLVVLVASGCTQSRSNSSNNGTFELMVSDQPSAIGDFSTLNVTFSSARVFPANNSSITFDLDSPTVDLTQLKGSKAQAILRRNLSAGSYTKIELNVENTNGVVNGSEVNVKVPSNKLMITKNFEVRPNGTTSFVFDIQVVERGNQGYNLLPVISNSGVAGEDVPVERTSDKGSRQKSSGKDRQPAKTAPGLN